MNSSSLNKSLFVSLKNDNSLEVMHYIKNGADVNQKLLAMNIVQYILRTEDRNVYDLLRKQKLDDRVWSPIIVNYAPDLSKVVDPDLNEHWPVNKSFEIAKLAGASLAIPGDFKLIDQVPFEGGNGQRWLWHLEKFISNPFFSLPTASGTELMVKLENVIKHSLQDSPEDIVKRVHNQDCVMIPVSWEDHQLFLTITPESETTSTLSICNPGERSEKYKTIETFSINPKKITTDILSTIKTYKNSSFETSEPFFYENLPLQLSPNGDYSPSGFFDSILPSNAKHSNCSFRSTVAALRPVLFHLLSTLKPDHSKEDLMDEAMLTGKYLSNSFAKRAKTQFETHLKRNKTGLVLLNPQEQTKRMQEAYNNKSSALENITNALSQFN